MRPSYFQLRNSPSFRRVSPPAGARRSPPWSASLLAAALFLAPPRIARADNDLTYQYEDYSESGGRIQIRTQGTFAEQDIGTDLHLQVGGILDAIAGATPTGAPAPAGSGQVPLTRLSDYRKAWNADLSDQLPRVNLSAGFARSVEDDYVSNGWSLNSLTTFNQKNTTLLAGMAGTDDRVAVPFQAAKLAKHGHDGILGVTQLLDALTSVSLAVTGSRETGFLNDQYKVVQKTIEPLPGILVPVTYVENRPDARNRIDALVSVNRAFPGLAGALEGSYRFYRDSYDIDSSTVEAAWFQHVGKNVILRPDLRFYQQGAASFYHYNLDTTGIFPSRLPTFQAPFYSSDARLAAFRGFDYGLKVIWNVTGWLQVTAAIGEYTQHGTDGVTPASAFYQARITSVAAKISW